MKIKEDFRLTSVNDICTLCNYQSDEKPIIVKVTVDDMQFDAVITARYNRTERHSDIAHIYEMDIDLIPVDTESNTVKADGSGMRVRVTNVISPVINKRFSDIELRRNKMPMKSVPDAEIKLYVPIEYEASDSDFGNGINDLWDAIAHDRSHIDNPYLTYANDSVIHKRIPIIVPIKSKHKK